MQLFRLLGHVYHFILVLTALCCLWRYRSLPVALKIIGILILITIIDEALATYFAYKYHNNLAVYSIFNLVQSFMIAVYFNYSIDVFRKRHIGYIVGILSITVGIANILLLQPLNHSNSYFLFFEGIVTISMSLFSFARLMLENKKEQLTQNPNFWIAALLTFFWVITFFDWGLYELVITMYPTKAMVLSVLMELSSIIIYGGIAIVFLNYNRTLKAY
jgi:hypothetical protein